MKIAIIHDTLIELGGAEQVLLALVKIFPQADIFTALINSELKNKIEQETQGKIVASPLTHLPWKERYASWLKPAINLYWERLNLEEYKLIISSSHSFNAKAVNTSSNGFHLSYIHTSPRYLYQEFNQIGLVSRSPIAFLFQPFMSIMRRWDYRSAQNPDILLANSQNVKARIKTYYQRNSEVVYPPIRFKPKSANQKGRQYYVTLSRLVEQKGLSLAVKACTQLKKKLVVVGTGPAEKKLKEIAGPTIEFKGFVPDSTLSQTLSKAKALIYPSIEEDFGLSPVEALTHGTPVIAHNSGATSEYVVPHQTGLLFKEHSLESLKNALHQFEENSWSAEACQKKARQFSHANFKQQIFDILRDKLSPNTFESLKQVSNYKNRPSD